MSKTDRKAYKRHTYSGSRKCLSRVRAGLKRYHEESSRIAVWRKKEQPTNEAINKNISCDDHNITPIIPKLKTYQRKRPTNSHEASTSTAEPTSAISEQPSTGEAPTAPEQPLLDLEVKKTTKKRGHTQLKKQKPKSIHDIYSNDSTDLSESEAEAEEGAAGPAPKSSPCCCCLAAAYTPAIDYTDLLSYCFDITYPAEVRVTATICPECVEKLNDGVRFKRRALECQGLLAAQGTDDNLRINVEPTAVLPSINKTIESGFNGIIKKQYDLVADDSEEVFYSEIDDGQPIDVNKHITSQIFAETHVTEATILAQSGFILTPYDNKCLDEGCDCGNNCFNIFSQSEVIAFRRECEMYQNYKCNTHHMNIFLTGVLACITDRSTPRNIVKFKFRDIPICEKFFKYIFAINDTQFNIILTKITDREKSIWTSKSISDQPLAIKFLKAYSTQNSLVLPGRFSNTYPDLHILPKNVTKTNVYIEYAKVCVAYKKRCVNQFIWEKLWKQFCPYIAHKMPRDMCKTCRENNKQLLKTVMNKSLNTEVLKRCYNHLQLVNDEIEFYERSMIRPTVLDDTLHFSVDFLQRLRLPHDPAVGFVNFLDGYTVALLSITCKPPAESVLYVVPERVGDDSRNTLLSLIHHFIESRRRRSVQWHCGPPLRAECVLQYAAWRGQAGRCRLAFLPPGHDERADCIALLKIALRTTPARTIRELCDVISTTGVTPIPVATETGLNIPIYDWVTFFNASNPLPISNAHDYCHFEADSGFLGALKCKVGASSEVHNFKTVFNGNLSGKPEVMLPAELSDQRRQCLKTFTPRLDEDEVLIEYPPNTDIDPLETVKEEINMEFEEHNIE